MFPLFIFVLLPDAKDNKSVFTPRPVEWRPELKFWVWSVRMYDRSANPGERLSAKGLNDVLNVLTMGWLHAFGMVQ